MKIGFVYDMIYPFSKGGAEKRFYHLARRLAQRHEVHWVGLKLWDGPATMVTEDGITLHGVARPPGKFYVGDGRRALLEPAWFGAALLQWPGLRKMDIIDCSSFPFFSVFSTRGLATLGGAHVVVTWHEVWGDYWKQYAGRVAPVGRLIERAVMRLTPRAVAVSRFTSDKLVEAGVSADRVSIIPNGIDLTLIDAAQPQRTGPDVLFMGRLIREKRVDLLLKALAEEPLARIRATCWIVGQGADLPVLQRMASGLGLDGRVTFISWLPEDQVYATMKSAKTIALLSEREGFGMVVLEAMACGTPAVVASGKISAAPDLVSPGETGYVTVPEPWAVSQAIARIVSTPDLRASMGQLAKRRAAAFDWAEITRQTESLYENTVGGQPHGAPARDPQWT